MIRDEYSLMDGVEQNKKYPESFYIPEEEDKDLIYPGVSCKLGFEPKLPYKLTERMWVEVTGKTKTGFVGTLSNQPVNLRLKPGDKVYFESKHILDIGIFNEEEDDTI